MAERLRRQTVNLFGVSRRRFESCFQQATELFVLIYITITPLLYLSYFSMLEELLLEAQPFQQLSRKGTSLRHRVILLEMVLRVAGYLMLSL